MTAKTSTERSDALRARREKLGQRRRELYATDAEWAKVQEFVRQLRREKK